MKIGILLSDMTKVGGIERVTSTLINELIHNDDIEIEIISLFKGKDNPAYPIPECVSIHYLTHDAHGAKPHSIKRGLRMLSTLSSVRKFLKKHNYDVLLVQSFPPAFLTFFSGFDRSRIIAEEHVFAGYYGNLVNRIRDFIYPCFGKIVVLTSNDLKYFQQRGIGKNIVVIPNPVMPSDEPKSTCNKKRIITVGRLVYQKGYDNLIRAFKSISDRHPDWKLDIFGDGPLKSDLLKLIEDYELVGKVNLCGLSNEIPKELSQSSIFVLSSHFEGFPMVLIEAMNQGVPCVSFNCPNGPSDIIKTGQNGILVPDQDFNKLIEGIEYLIINEDKRKQYGQYAPKSVSVFSKEIIADKWIRLFNQVIHNG